MRRPPCLVLVDDSEAERALFQEALKERGHQIEAVVFTDGRQARKYFESKAAADDVPPPDLVLVDYYLRGMSGADLLAFLRQQRAFAEVPMYLFTADHRCGQQPIQDVEPARCLRKPSSWEEMIALVDRLAAEIQRYRSRQAP